MQGLQQAYSEGQAIGVERAFKLCFRSTPKYRRYVELLRVPATGLQWGMNGDQSVCNRLFDEFVEELPMSKEPHFEINFVRVEPGCDELDNNEIL